MLKSSRDSGGDLVFVPHTKLETVFIDIIPATDVAFLAYQEAELDVVRLGPAEIVRTSANARTDEVLGRDRDPETAQTH